MKLSIITKDPDLAIQAEAAGIDRIFIDLERLGKAERQTGRNLFLSDHCLLDIAKIRRVIHKAKVLVRIDPLHPGSKQQIANGIDAGADMIMLPYFHRLDEAQEFVDLVRGKATALLLVETPEAAAILADLCRLPGVSEIHVGLNDLSISLGKQFLFDLIVDGTAEKLCDVLRRSGLPFGFGGIGCLKRRDLPVAPELILAFQICQGATRGWLGRSFRDFKISQLRESVAELRAAIEYWNSADLQEKERMRLELMCQISSVSACSA